MIGVATVKGMGATTVGIALCAGVSCALLTAHSVAQGTTRFDALGVSRLRWFRVQHWAWSEVRSWHLSSGAVWFETSGRPLGVLLSYWPVPAAMIDALRAEIPERERASLTPRGPLHARTGVAVFASIAMLVGGAASVAMCVSTLRSMSPLSTKLVHIVGAVGFATMLAALLVASLSQASTRIDSRGIERRVGFRRAMMLWSDVRSWHEYDGGFVLDTASGPWRLGSGFWRSRAEVRHVLRSNVGSERSHEHNA